MVDPYRSFKRIKYEMVFLEHQNSWNCQDTREKHIQGIHLEVGMAAISLSEDTQGLLQ